MAQLSIRDAKGSSFPSVFQRELARRPEVDVREIQALRQVDLVAPPEAASASEHLVEQFRAKASSGDHLRLAQKTHLDGASVRKALRRVTDLDLKKIPVADRDAAVKEARMHQVLGALLSTYEQIQNNHRVVVGG